MMCRFSGVKHKSGWRPGESTIYYSIASSSPRHDASRPSMIIVWLCCVAQPPSPFLYTPDTHMEHMCDLYYIYICVYLQFAFGGAM